MAILESLLVVLTTKDLKVRTSLQSVDRSVPGKVCVVCKHVHYEYFSMVTGVDGKIMYLSRGAALAVISLCWV